MNMNEDVTSAGSQATTTPTPEAGSTGPETSQPLSQRKLSGSEQLGAIEQLLKGSQDDDADPGDAGDTPESATGDDTGGGSEAPVLDDVEPLSLQSIADKLEIDPEKLYKELRIPHSIGDGGEVSIGELKDVYHKQEASKAEIAKQDEALKRREGGLVSDVQALGLLQARGQLPPETLQQVNTQLVEMAQRTYGDFLDLYPTLKEDGNRVAFEKNINDELSKVGLTPAHFPVQHVGMFQMFKELIDLRAENKKLKKPTPKKAETPVKRNRQKAPPRQQPLTGVKSRRAELSAIADILKAK